MIPRPSRGRGGRGRLRAILDHPYADDLAAAGHRELRGSGLLDGLRDWLVVCDHAALAAFVTLPSEAVAAAWRAFAATEGYPAFCRDAFGEVLRPGPITRAPRGMREDGLLRTWSLACHSLGLDPRRPRELPWLFRADAELGWPDGLSWELTGDIPAVRRSGPREPTTICAWSPIPEVEMVSRYHL
ncbi:MAG: hypothetical protein AB7V62_16355 [Thermoleophilia bacterium]